jgi:signal transduction histidine kinase
LIRLGLTERIVVGATLVAAVFIGQLVLSASQLHQIEKATEQEQRAADATVAAVRVEKLVLDLENGQRGFVLTGNPAFLQPWTAAQRQLPQQSRTLLSLAPGPAAAQLDREWRAYLTQWSIPTVRLARASLPAARRRVATQGGKSRVDRIRALVAGFVAHQDAASATARRHIHDDEHSGTRLAFVGAGFRVLVFLFILWWLLQAVVRPLRRVAEATTRVARGELDVQVEEAGSGEVGRLSRSFNVMSRSLTRSRQALEEQNEDLERLANVLRAVLDATVDGILLSDAEGNVQLANRPIVELTRDLGMSYEPQNVVDRLLSVAERMRDPEGYREAMERLRSSPELTTFDEFEDSVSGRVFQGFTSPVRDDRGGFVGRIWTLREVTHQRELDRLKDDFVATVSHELRTPLTSMMGFLEMLRDEEAGQLSDEQKRFLAIVYRSSERLQRLVGDLLFVARLDANGLQMRYDDVQVDDVVRECVEASSAIARSRNIELVADLPELPPIRGDRERLGQLVSNLVSNAIKFTPEGGHVTIRTRPAGNVVALEVEDDGIGIPEAEQSRVFQRFFRSSTATQQAIPGTGLGLVISKAIAEAHGGVMSMRSEEGRGTCFRVELPLRQTV